MHEHFYVTGRPADVYQTRLVCVYSVCQQIRYSICLTWVYRWHRSGMCSDVCVCVCHLLQSSRRCYVSTSCSLPVIVVRRRLASTRQTAQISSSETCYKSRCCVQPFHDCITYQWHIRKTIEYGFRRPSVDVDAFATKYVNQGVTLTFDLQNISLIRWWVGDRLLSVSFIEIAQVVHSWDMVFTRFNLDGAVTLTFDIQHLIKSSVELYWVFPVSFIKIVQAVHEISR